MESVKHSENPYGLYEYLLVLNPDEKESRKVSAEKQYYFSKYKASTAIYGKPHITLANFLYIEKFEKMVIQDLRKVATTTCPINVEMKDYGNFSPHTIFINVITEAPIQNLVKRIRIKTNKVLTLDPENKPRFIMKPHVTIARKLLPWQYEQSSIEYSERSYSGMFVADKMLLLKRQIGEQKYQLIGEFFFNGLNGPAIQPGLFD